MTLLTCSAVRRRLAAFHDRELPVHELIAVEGHVNNCPPCAEDLSEIEQVGAALRLAAARGPADDWAGLAPGVISRMRAEANESLSARAHRLFEDMHLVWIALASTAGTFLCGAAVAGMLHFASEERTDSMAGVIAVMAAPAGSDLNPARLDGRIRVPSLPQDGMVSAALANKASSDEMVLTLSAVVTREGRVAGVSVLTNDHDRRQVIDILHAIAQSRLQPAVSGDTPIAVNLVWLLAHTTVKGKLSS
jgi:hypothetical protein